MPDQNDNMTEDEKLAAEWAAMADETVEAQTDAAMAGGDGAGGGEAERVLSQDEIDNLLGFDDRAGNSETTGIQALINSALVSYERLPMFEVIIDRMVRDLTTSLRNFTSDNVEISIDGITSTRFGDYINSIPLPAMMAVFKAEEWDNYGLITINSALIYSIVDVLLGGRRGTAAMRIEGRPYTTIERNLIERLTGVVLADLGKAFDPLTKVNFRLDRLETNPRFATIARTANGVIVAKLRIDMDDRGGRLELVMPYATLEPVRDQLLQMFLGEKFGRDAMWETHLATELWNTDVELTAVLDEQSISLAEVMDFKPGTRLLLNATPESLVDLRCGETRMFAGQMGRRGVNKAICIDRRLENEEHLQ
jgi:flagellar motor switch protein FliM